MELSFQRLAVTPEQIDLLDLPTGPTKASDSRSRTFAGESVEVDAIPTTVLRRLVEDAIEQHIDQHALTITRPVEASDRQYPHHARRSRVMTGSDDLLEAALAYAAHGWPVLPLRGKLPARSKADGGRGFHDATTDPDLVERMWQAYPGANVGIRTGALSGLAVLDLDPAHGGVASLTRIESERGVLPGTVAAITGGDGLHMLYRHRPGLGCGSNVWGPGLDLRAEGGYIVAAPSHHSSGYRYRWSGDGTWQHPLPAWPVKQLPYERPRSAPAPAVTYLRRPGLGPLAGLLRVVLDATDGDRNTRLNWAAYRAGEHVRSGRLDQREAAAALYEAAARIGLGDREAVATIASGLGGGEAA